MIMYCHTQLLTKSITITLQALLKAPQKSYSKVKATFVYKLIKVKQCMDDESDGKSQTEELS